MDTILDKDSKKYGGIGKIPRFQIYYRKIQMSKMGGVIFGIDFYLEFIRKLIILNCLQKQS